MIQDYNENNEENRKEGRTLRAKKRTREAVW